MKRPNTTCAICLLAAGAVALASFCLLEAGAGNALAAPPSDWNPAGTIIITDAGGHIVPNGQPSATSQIFDVTVGPAGQRIFSPAGVNIAVGDTVRWTWASNNHSVRSGISCIGNGDFCSPSDTNCNILSNTNTVYQHTFTQAGSFSYHCAAHCGSGMVGIVQVTASCTPPPADMVVWFPGDGSGRDIQGGRSGTPQGNVTFVPGKVAEAFSLDGLGDRILVGNPPSLQLQDFTIDAWIKRASATLVTNDPVGNPGAVFFAYGNLGYGFGIDQSTGRTFLTHVGVTASFSVATITDTNYHHVAVTKQGGTVTFYVDGVADAPVTYNPTFTFTTGAAIGARGDNDLRNAFFGDIDELEIFNRVLTPSEISAVFNAGSAGKCKPPQPANAFSRKMHGANGPFDIDLMPNAMAGVECRTGGASGVYQMVVQFPAPVAITGASILSGSGSVSGFTNNAGVVTIDLTNVGNAQTLVVKLNGVTDGTLFGDVPIAMSVLLGDSNGDAVVNSGDATQVRTRSGQSAAPANFRSDVNADGTINSGDAFIARSRSGQFIP